MTHHRLLDRVLPPDVLREINGYLSGDQAFFATSQIVWRAVRMDRLARYLLAYVAKGDQDKACAMIDAIPKLLFHKSQVTDQAGRTFHGINALQYAAWALDLPMVTGMIACVPDDYDEIVSQLNQLKERGTTHGPHYDFTPLLTALRIYCEQHDHWTPEERQKHWCEQVGQAQRHMPTHLAQHYCHATPLFPYEEHQFDTRPTTLFIKKGLFERIAWFPLQPHTGLGFDFAITRGDEMENAFAKPGDRGCPTSALFDLDALETLFKTNQAALFNMEQRSPSNSP